MNNTEVGTTNQAWFLKLPSKSGTPLARLIKQKRETLKINDVRNMNINLYMRNIVEIVK